MLDAKTGLPRQPNSSLSLRGILHSLHVPLDFALHNAGNDAFACLLVFQMLVDPKNTQVPPPRMNPAGMALVGNMIHGSVPFLSPMLSPPMMATATLPRSRSASNIPQLNTGETMLRQSSTFPNRLSLGDPDMSAGIPDEEGRIKDTQEFLSSKLANATIG